MVRGAKSTRFHSQISPPDPVAHRPDSWEAARTQVLLHRAPLLSALHKQSPHLRRHRSCPRVRARNPRPTLKTMSWESTGWPSVIPLHPHTFPLIRKRRASLSTWRTLGRALPAGRHDARHIGFRRAKEGG